MKRQTDPCGMTEADSRSGMTKEATADPSTSLRSGRDDELVGITSRRDDRLWCNSGRNGRFRGDFRDRMLAVSCQFVFQGVCEFCEAIPLALVLVDVLDGDDAAGDLAVEVDDRGGG